MGYGQIISRSFAYAPDKALKLSHSCFSRPLTVGRSWSRLRLGLLWSLDGSAGFGDGYFAFGLGSSSSPPVSAYAVQTFFGMVSGPMATASKAFSITSPAGSPSNQYFGCSTNCQALRKFEGYSAHTVGSTVLYVARSAFGASFRRTPIIIDISRQPGGGGNATMYAWSTNTASVQVDYRPDQLYQALDTWSISAPVIAGQTLTALLAGVSTPIGEMLGILDSVQILWLNSVVSADIHCVTALVMSPGYDYSGTAQGGAYHNFESYATGTWPMRSDPPRDTSVTLFGTGTYAAECGWAGSLLLSGTISNEFVQVGWAGTSLRYPYDGFEVYTGGTALPGIVNSGTSWISYGSFYGSGNPNAQAGWAGTSLGYPIETFESYGTGSTGTIALSAGTTWASWGTLY